MVSQSDSKQSRKTRNKHTFSYLYKQRYLPFFPIQRLKKKKVLSWIYQIDDPNFFWSLSLSENYSGVRGGFDHCTKHQLLLMTHGFTVTYESIFINVQIVMKYTFEIQILKKKLKLLSILLNKILGMLACVFFSNGFRFLIGGFINQIININYFTKNKERKIKHKNNTSVQGLAVFSHIDNSSHTH